MAKKKEEVSTYLSASYILERETLVIPVSPALDINLGGGIPEGSVVVISGPEKLGKTSLALKIMANAQKLGRIGVYIDIEHRLKSMNLTGIKGLDLSEDKFKLVRSSEGSLLCAEQSLEIAEAALSDFPGCVLIIDSLSSLYSKAQVDNELGKGFSVQARKVETDFFKRIPASLSINHNIVIAMAHIRQNMGKHGGTYESMAAYTQYAQDVKLKVGRPGFNSGIDFEWNSGTKRIGHRVQWTVANSALSAPGGKCIGYLRYGIGIDDIAEMLELASELNVIQKSGSWMNFPSGEKAQGFDKAYNYLAEHPEEYVSIEKSVRELLS